MAFLVAICEQQARNPTGEISTLAKAARSSLGFESMDDDDDIELESSEDSNSERGQPRRSRRRPRFTYENDDEELAANLQFGHSEDENEADFQDFSDEAEAEDDVKD